MIYTRSTHVYSDPQIHHEFGSQLVDEDVDVDRAYDAPHDDAHRHARSAGSRVQRGVVIWWQEGYQMVGGDAGEPDVCMRILSMENQIRRRNQNCTRWNAEEEKLKILL